MYKGDDVSLNTFFLVTYKDGLAQYCSNAIISILD